MELLLFGGTTEGRELATELAGREDCEVWVCSATEYGSALLPESPQVHALTGRLDSGAMVELMASRPFACVVDATHPFAVEVTANIAAAAQEAGIPYLRLAREDLTVSDPSVKLTVSRSAEEAALLLQDMPGKVLLTTGSKDLPVYAAALPDYQERLYVRILPLESSLAATRELDIPPSHVIAMQGPFSQAFNAALIRELGISVMVTKASGATGGVQEKIDAARAEGIDLIVIQRPQEPGSLSPAELLGVLERRFKLSNKARDERRSSCM